MNKINWINGQSGGTPLSAENLNLMQNNIEDAIPDVKTEESVSNEDTYACSYINDKLSTINNSLNISKNNIFTANSGFTIVNQYIYKQGKHYFGDLIVKKNSGNFSADGTQLGTLNVTPTWNINSGCYVSNDEWKVTGVGYLYINKTNKIVNVSASNVNYAKIHIDFMAE